jgi:macrodomain Ter protein organizer (MatP/YcbG family)
LKAQSSTSAIIVEQGCKVIANLSSNKKNKEKVLSMGILTLASDMENNEKVPDRTKEVFKRLSDFLKK